MAKAKKAKAAPKKAAKKAAAKKAPATNALGCCNIIYDDATPSEQVPGVTRDACTRLGIARGGHGKWNPGACA
jgi:hypothetical protein